MSSRLGMSAGALELEATIEASLQTVTRAHMREEANAVIECVVHSYTRCANGLSTGTPTWNRRRLELLRMPALRSAGAAGGMHTRWIDSVRARM